MIRIWIFVTFLSLAIMSLGFYLGERVGLFLGLLIAVLFHATIYFFGERPLLKAFKHQRVEGQDPWGLSEKLVRLCEHMNMPETPHLYVIQHTSPIVFSINGLWSRSFIAISQVVLDKLSSAEVKALLCQQLLQMKYYNQFFLNFLIVISNSMIGLGQSLDRYLKLGSFFVKFFSYIAWLPLRLFFRHGLFYHADSQSVQLTHDPQALATALWKLESLSLARPYRAPIGSHYLFLYDPTASVSSKKYAGWLDIHPSFENRIRKLIGQYPL